MERLNNSTRTALAGRSTRAEKLGAMRGFFLEHYRLQTLQGTQTTTLIDLRGAQPELVVTNQLAEAVARESAARFCPAHAE